jgi:hypothetical protein
MLVRANLDGVPTEAGIGLALFYCLRLADLKGLLLGVREVFPLPML